MKKIKDESTFHSENLKGMPIILIFFLLAIKGKYFIEEDYVLND